MPLETATYIDDLVLTNPVATDGLGQTDDHLRLIKSTLQATFPNIDGPVTGTPAQLNALAAGAAIGLVPIGGMVIWPTATLPVAATYGTYGWCNGQAVSRTTYATLFGLLGTTWGSGDGSTTFNLPDLRERVPVGTGAMGGVSDAGRIDNHTTTLAAAFGTSTHTLVTAELASHTHGFTTNSDGSHSHSSGSVSATITVSGSGTHSHTEFSTNTDGLHTHETTGYLNSGAGGNTGPLATQTGSNAITLTVASSASSHQHSGIDTGTDGSHSHTGSLTNGSVASTGSAHAHDGTTNSQGSGTAHNNVQPSIAINYVIRML
jgi:microcystin-dependent protein